MDYDVVLYIKNPPDRVVLEKMVKALEDPVEDLVRKDAKFKKLGLDPDDFVGNPGAVVEIILQHKQHLQRPLLVKGRKAIIGRPKSRINELLG